MYGFMASAALLSVATACSDANDPQDSSLGKIDLLVDLDGEALEASGGGRSDFDPDVNITVDDLKLTLTPSYGDNVYTWNSIADFDVSKQFPVGDYTLAASYGNIEDEGFAKPYFYGETTFKVKENQTTTVALTARLANSMVLVQASEAFTGYFSDASFTIHSAEGEYLPYEVDETRPVYVRPGQVTLTANVTTPTGQSVSLEAASFTALPQCRYTVNVDVNNGSAGEAVLTISYTDETTPQYVEIDLTDELLNAPAPEITAEGFDPETTYTIIDGLPEGLAPAMTIIARNGLAGVTMTTQSVSLLAAGWPAEIDLLTASDTQQQLLSELGLKAVGLYKNPDKMAVVNLSGVLNNIYYVKDATEENTISFVVKDKMGKLSEVTTLNITTSPIEVTVGQPVSALPTFETSLTVPVTYNGSNINNVSLYIKNNRGTFDKVEGVTYENVGEGVYNATLTVPSDDKDVVLYAKCKDVTSPTITIVREKINFTLTVNDNNVFAKYAVVNVLANGESATSVPSSVKIQIAKSDGNYENATYSYLGGDKVKIQGLTGGTLYHARVFYNNEATESVDFTTENATTLENGQLENWENNPVTAGNVSADLWSCSNWATLNEKTTSALNRNTKYSGLSSTCRDDNGRTGYGALIRSVGYGCSAGSSSTGIGAANTNASAYSQGELYLGSYEDAPNYGMEFASRPSSLSFWYKYSPISDDLGYAEITVYDDSNNVLATKNVSLQSASEYTQTTLSLDYPENANKAAKISVVFRSTNDTANHLTSAYIPKNSTSNVLGGVTLTDYFVGSQLYVDDIELIY